MPSHWPHAAIYLSGTASSYWRWGENQEMAWADDRTIAFWPEVGTVLNRLAPEGLPPFGAVLLLLAACRENWSEPPSRRGLLAGALKSEGGDHASALLTEVCDCLDKVYALPKELRYSPAAKADLAAMVFENVQSRLSPQVSREIVESLTSWNGSAPAAPVTTSSFWLTRDLVHCGQDCRGSTSKLCDCARRPAWNRCRGRRRSKRHRSPAGLGSAGSHNKKNSPDWVCWRSDCWRRSIFRGI